jgi:hypothetical protein
MTLASSQVRVAGTGELFLAPLGTALPSTASAALASDYVGHGYTTDDGVVLSKSVEREGVPAWQSSTPVRYLVTGQEFTIQTTFLQSNAEIVKLWLGSGDFDGTTPDWSTDVPIDPVGQQFVLCLEWKDDALTSRLLVPKVEITETGDVTLARTEATAFPVTFGALAPESGTVLAQWLTNDPAFEPAGP